MFFGLRLSRGTVIIFMFGLTVGVLFGPVKRVLLTSVFQGTYSTHLYECDSAMRGHLRAKMHIVDEPSEESVERLRASEIALFACQDYDIMQKRFMQFGLTENDLSLMRLLAIEERASDLQDVVAIHELRY